MPYAIGLNSGSSFDGIDAVVIQIEQDAEGQLTPPKFVTGLSHDWPQEVKDLVLRAFANELSLFDMTRLNYTVGAIFAEVAQAVLEQAKLKPADVSVIGYDGQTVYQEPPEQDSMKRVGPGEHWYRRWTVGGYPCGMQIGEPGVVATLVDIPVVSQFRSVDHALGGTGAPLMQFLDYIVFRGVGPTVTLNIGGISNLQLALADRSKMMAFDCGPGNVMIDHAMMRLYSRAYDTDGEVAAKGSVVPELLTGLMNHPFFKRPVPRCAWRLDFGADYADTILHKYRMLSSEDLVATITRFSAEAIISSYLEFVVPKQDVTQIVVSGGGVRNATLMRLITEMLPSGVALVLSDEYGMPTQFKEAIKFATLASATLISNANNIPAACGAARFGVLGKLVQAPRNVRLTT
ncbi:MAG: anhydro-N-acetylmuramic acid kinase [Bifidobacteriaceae bacterium]|jgi:anhydro-N-acetylmuramic acid kinase|nr:anhydro-N-acetylmuramic acid kinase [Bifidobacteriaceae bacterium]